MKKIDRYLGRMYLVNYAGALGLFVLIAIAFDLTEKLDGFLKHSLGVYQVWNEYYVHFTPYYANLLSPLFVFIAVIFKQTSREQNKTRINKNNCMNNDQ